MGLIVSGGATNQSLSAGILGFTLNFGRKGTRTTTSLPALVGHTLGPEYQTRRSVLGGEDEPECGHDHDREREPTKERDGA
jgi:hypothetical protein